MNRWITTYLHVKPPVKKGVALIMTMAVLTALSMLGITFLGLLSKDQKVNRMQSSEWLANSSLYSAIQAGIFEINLQTSTEPHYFHSIIQSATDTSLIYFRNAIKATNAKLSLSQEGPELYHVLTQLSGIIGSKPPISTEYGTFTTQMTNLINAMRLYTKQVPDVFYHPAELVMLPDEISTFNARAYSYLLPYVTVYPTTKNDRIANIIDYGNCVSTDPFQITLLNRNFKPVGTIDSVAGAYIKIISGKGSEQLPKKILNADTVQGVLNLQDDWDNSLDLPDQSSIYRIYSYVTPINFNCASVELIQANFSVLSDYFTTRSMTGVIGDYDTGAISPGTFMRQLKYFREDVPALFRNLNEFKALYLQNIVGLVSQEENKKEVLRFFDPTQPKGIQVGSEIHIYPVPLPLAFTHNGFFDMDIDHTYQFSFLGAQKNLKHHALTVQVGKSIILNTAEEFRDKGKPNWMSLSDWVPTRNLNDFQNWSRIYSWNGSISNFNPYAAATEDANVIPDAIKTGLWFDFSALDGNQNREKDPLYNPLINAYIEQSEIASMFYTASTGKGISSIGSGVFTIAGGDALTPAPEAKIYVGPDSGTGSTLFEFGDLSARVKMQENTTLWPYYTHPPDYSSPEWYKNPPPTTVFLNHNWADHTDVTIGTDTHKTYPPRRYFTPALFMRDTVILRNEIGYAPSSPFESTYINCSQPLSASGEEARYTIGNETSLTLNNEIASRYKALNSINMTDPLEAKVTAFSLMNHHASIMTQQNLTNTNFTRADDTSAMPLLNESLPTSSPNLSLPASGHVGFMREFPSSYYHDTTLNPTLPFNVEYLRIIPSKKQTTYPYYETNVLNIKDAVRYKTITVNYRIGLFKNRTFDNTQFDIVAELDMAPASSFTPDFPARRLTIDFNDLSLAEGHIEFDLRDPATFPVELYPTTGGIPANESFKLRIYIEKSSDDPDLYHSLLNTTIAITGISVYADTKTTSLGVSNTN